MRCTETPWGCDRNSQIHMSHRHQPFQFSRTFGVLPVQQSSNLRPVRSGFLVQSVKVTLRISFQVLLMALVQGPHLSAHRPHERPLMEYCWNLQIWLSMSGVGPEACVPNRCCTEQQMLAKLEFCRFLAAGQVLILPQAKATHFYMDPG